MRIEVMFVIAFCAFLISCQQNEMAEVIDASGVRTPWNIDSLQNRSLNNLDSTKWDFELFSQDITTYSQFTEILNSYPLNKSPFPVAKYDYSVSSIPFTIAMEGSILKGVKIGEYKTPESELVIDRLTLLVLTNDIDAEENTMVDSRNYPYLTAQGTFKVSNNELDWVFAYSQDGFANLIINMKLFDLRFGETIIIYPQNDKSFVYDQIDDSPNNYESFELFENALMNRKRVRNQLLSPSNIQAL